MCTFYCIVLLHRPLCWTVGNYYVDIIIEDNLTDYFDKQINLQKAFCTQILCIPKNASVDVKISTFCRKFEGWGHEAVDHNILKTISMTLMNWFTLLSIFYFELWLTDHSTLAMDITVHINWPDLSIHRCICLLEYTKSKFKFRHWPRLLLDQKSTWRVLDVY